MKSRSPMLLLPALIMLATVLHLSPTPARAQDKKASLRQTAFSSAAIRWNPETNLPADIQMDASVSLNEEDFLKNLRSAFGLPDNLQFVTEKESTGPPGETSIRYRLQYQGIELAHTQYIIQLEEGRVKHAHGPLVGKPSVELTPSLDKQEAFRKACAYLGLNEKEASQNGAVMSRLSLSRDAHGENGTLMLSSGFSDKQPEHYRLVYSFDITTLDPLQRFDVEIDAHSGELVASYPTLYRENIPTMGYSLYNGAVNIVISDTIFKSDWPDNDAYWHTDTWNTYQGSGQSWWMADTASYNPGGYGDDLHVALETDPIILSGTTLRLNFYHRYSMEDPSGASGYNRNYDGWDGINVRISKDGGNTWNVLANPLPAYTCTSLWSFGGIHGEGPGIPGWAGQQYDWAPVIFNLSAYLHDTVLIRFEFASDAAFSTKDSNTMFGWQIDKIEVRNSSQVLYSNSGTSTNMHPYTISNWVGNIEGKYRLRETNRGKGIATINAENGLGFTNYVDFVQDTFPIIAEPNRVGVGIHWASERTYDFYLEKFGRNSFDDEGGAIVSYADWIEGDDRNNAMWSGSFAVYGAGDGLIRGSFGTVDVVGHEITHGVTDHSARLIYRGESGALNESFSDIFGVAVEFYAEGIDKGDWQNGEDIFNGSGAIRSLEDPNVFSDPDTYFGDYWFDTDIGLDNGGVHINSGVQNHWFYLLTQGGTGENDDGFLYQVTGIGLEDASAIAYRNLTHYLLPDSKYVDAAYYSIRSAGDLFGEASQQVQSTRSAWEAVGIYMDPHLMSSDTLLHFESTTKDSDYKLLILRNKSIEPLEVSGFSFSDPDHFAFLPAVVTPIQFDGGDSVKLWIAFSPEDDSLYNATLTVESSDPKQPLRTVHLSGTGTIDATGLPERSREISGARLSVYPNPFKERLLISYTLPAPDQISIEIRDITGKLFYRSVRNAGAKETVEIIWDDMHADSHPSSGGIYVLSLRTSSQVLVKKIVRQ
jgi:Zn-dependent metalloprotease